MTSSSWINTSMFAIILAAVLGTVYLIVHVDPIPCPLQAEDLVRPKLGGPVGMVVYTRPEGELWIRFSTTNVLVSMKCFEVDKVVNQKGK